MFASTSSYDTIATFSFGSSSYSVHFAEGGINRNAAAEDATANSFRLVSIETEAENDAIFDVIKDFEVLWVSPSSTRHIGPWTSGVIDDGGNLTWDSASESRYTNWAGGEPNDYGGSEAFVHFLSKSTWNSLMGTWNDLPESGIWPIGSSEDYVVSGFIVEMDRVTGNRNDSIQGSEGVDYLNGLRGNDTLLGGLGNDQLNGNAGSDRLFGEKGADQLFGGRGRDLLKGSSGHDTLDGGSGNDRLVGGRGADVFVFSEGRDSVRDFDSRDSVDLTRAEDISNFEDLRDHHLTETDLGTEIRDGSGNVVVLMGISLDNLTSEDFLF